MQVRTLPALVCSVLFFTCASRRVFATCPKPRSVHTGDIVGRPASFKDLLLRYKDVSPFLYSKCRLAPNLEHVVPVSVLKKHVPPPLLTRAVQDPNNLFLAHSISNQKRSNYRFLLHPRPVTGEVPGGFQCVGSECYISHNDRLFIPRMLDCYTIARSVQYCHGKYKIPYEDVVFGGKDVVDAWLTGSKSKEERVHALLVDFYNHVGH